MYNGNNFLKKRLVKLYRWVTGCWANNKVLAIYFFKKYWKFVLAVVLWLNKFFNSVFFKSFWDRFCMSFWTRNVDIVAQSLDAKVGLFVFFFVLGLLFFAFITIWTRAVGPRFRLDQLSKFTWKSVLFFIFFIIILVFFFYSVF